VAKYLSSSTQIEKILNRFPSCSIVKYP